MTVLKIQVVKFGIEGSSGFRFDSKCFRKLRLGVLAFHGFLGFMALGLFFRVRLRPMCSCMSCSGDYMGLHSTYKASER